MKYTVSGKRILAKKYKSWDEFENAVASLKEPKPKGDAFEDFFYIYLNLKKRKFQVKGNEIYRRNELPKKWQKELKLKNRYADKGTDFFWQKTDGKTTHAAMLGCIQKVNGGYLRLQLSHTNTLL